MGGTENVPERDTAFVLDDGEEKYVAIFLVLITNDCTRQLQFFSIM